MTAVCSPKKEAQEEALRRATQALAGVDLVARCDRLGLPRPGADGRVSLAWLGRSVVLAPLDGAAWDAASGAALHLADRLVLLHALTHTRALRSRGEWVAFRQFPGGQFYIGPFEQRTVRPLVRSIGDSIGLLERRLSQRGWRATGRGDLGAAVAILGPLSLQLIYRCADEEFPASAEILFDAGCIEAFCAEDAAAVAARLCLGLCGPVCVQCGGFGLCDRGAGAHCG